MQRAAVAAHSVRLTRRLVRLTGFGPELAMARRQVRGSHASAAAAARRRRTGAHGGIQ